MIKKVSHHGLSAWLEIQFSYNELNPNIKMIIDVVARGALMGKKLDEAYKLLEEMASNSYKWQSDRAMPRKAARVHEIDVISTIHAQLVLLTKKLDATNVSAIQTQNPPNAEFIARQPANEGQVGNFGFASTEQANYMNNFQKNNNSYSNTYTPVWRSHLNLGWVVTTITVL